MKKIPAFIRYKSRIVCGGVLAQIQRNYTVGDDKSKIEPGYLQLLVFLKLMIDYNAHF